MFRHPQIQCFETYYSMSNPTSDFPSCWSTVMVPFIPLMVSKPLQGTETPMSCQGSHFTAFLPQAWLLQEIFPVSPGLWVKGRQQQTACLALCCHGSDAQPGPLAPGFSAETPPARFGEQFCNKAPPLITHCSHFCCMLLINFSTVVKTMNGLEKQ